MNSKDYKTFLNVVKLNLQKGILDRMQAIKAIYNVMPEADKSLKAAKEMVDEWKPLPKAEPFLRQRQDSLTDQMKTVYKLANKNGCYDAADWLKRHFFKEK